MLDYKQLEAFAMVVIEGGFEKASRKLNLTQSAVSQRVRLLEDYYGSVLLKRSSPPEPTEAGIPLLVHYRKVSQLESDITAAGADELNTEVISLAIGINADTLATWFYTAVCGFLDNNNVTLDLYVDDQDRTDELLKDGKVWGCVSTRRQPLQGCRADYLGTVKYGIFATEEFRQRWFGEELTLGAFENAPMARYNRKDDLNSRMFEELFGAVPKNPPVFFIPSTETYGLFVAAGRCWGVLPEQQSDLFEQEGRIINLSPQHSVNVHLYWHSWNLKSKTMDAFSSHFLQQAGKILRQ